MAVRFDRQSVAGFVDPSTFVQGDVIELLTPGGALQRMPLSEVKALCYLKDLEALPTWRPNRLFFTRPKTEGLWVRFRFQDGDVMDGLLPNDLLQVDPAGYTVAPPDPTFQNQRIFVPRAATAEVRVLGVVGTDLRRRKERRPVEGQLSMFEPGTEKKN